MFCRWTAPSVFIVLFLRVQSIDSSLAPDNSLETFDLPEIDGSAVDCCRIFPLPTPQTTTTATPTTTPTTTTTTPTTRKVTTTTKPATRPPPKIDHASINILLQYLLANSRRHTGGSLPRVISQPRRVQSSSESNEAARRRHRIVGRRNTGSSSSDSSDES
ncbi:probable serine/threonine-protein kinase nek3 [Sparus aurata]|uniref:probable serine/threonine-protein kinase nek3 n=1 Tax=Sparus aurata TaxID=8175 RepID=UPI0011C13B67|nr:probable serine/threonine-protein kinase nek3 [Sparus aurata]